MGRTLFWYVFKDLVKVFLMTSGALAGILSFGGLLRPLTQQGLDPGQIGKILTYFTPAMTTYSFPIAALFAATVVYGRLSADNELTACRAGGLSLGPFLGMAFPALVFGLIVAITQLLFLCFIVPVYTLKVEKVLYSNLAKLIATKIDRNHKIEFGDSEVYAQRAIIPPPDPAHPGRQQVLLVGVSIVAFERPVPSKSSQDKGVPGHDARFKIPSQFWLASSATIDIDDRGSRADSDAPGGSPVRLLIGLEGAYKFPRELIGGMQAGVGIGQFGPIDISSPIKEDPKFMTVSRLKWLYENPEQSRKINDVVGNFLRRDQEQKYLEQIGAELNRGERNVTFLPVTHEAAEGTTEATNVQTGDRVVLTIGDIGSATLGGGAKIEQERDLIFTGTKADAVHLDYFHPGEPVNHQTSKSLSIRAHPDPLTDTMNVTITLIERTPPNERIPVSSQYTEVFTTAMPADVREFKDRKIEYYRAHTPVLSSDRSLLSHEIVSLANGLMAESSSRASFAVSCLILVIVGCALGMMFRSGNFLTAFAVSFIPALLCITLIVAGQQTCRSVPWTDAIKHNPLKFGLALIWSGNVMNAIIAIGLMFKLQKQ